MKMRKTIASIAAMATVCAFAVSANAADWSKSSYADDNPETVNIISTDADGVTFTQGTPGGSCKARIMWTDILENPDDISKVYSGTWDVTYTGLSAFSGTEIGWLGGGAWCSVGNSAGFNLAPDSYDENEAPVWEDTQTVQDSFKWLLGGPETADSEVVLMDWSGQDLVANNVTVRVSNFKVFDKDGNEIIQKAYAAAAPAVEETPVAEAPAADTATEAPAATGNASAAAVAAVMAVAGAAAVVSKRK